MLQSKKKRYLKKNSLRKTYLANIDKPPSGQKFRSKITGKIIKNMFILCIIIKPNVS